MFENKKIIVVDDDQEIRVLLEEYLTKQGFDVTLAAGGVELKRHLAQFMPDLILMDIMMPGDDGFVLCQQIRKTSNVPIIMLTAVSDETDQIIGLEIGADDYVAKPFSPRQLLARIKAVLRRSNTTEVETTTVIEFDRWSLDTISHRLHDKNSAKEVELTGSDFSLLMLFLSHPNQILDRDKISNTTKGRDALPLERGIDVQVSRLRQQLNDNGKNSKLIKTVRGAGYQFLAAVKHV